MNFCSECGHTVAFKIPNDDNRPRYICDQCDTIHYQNPKIITGCLVTHHDQVLLCRRAIEPRYGLWTLPAGFMENGETVAAGALRESWEEAQTNLHLHDLYTIFNLPHINQVYMIYRATLADTNFAPGPESLEVELFGETDIPWDALAFGTVVKTLKHYFEDRQQQHFPLHVGDIERK